MAWIVNYTNKIPKAGPMDFRMKKITDNQARELSKLELKALRM